MLYKSYGLITAKITAEEISTMHCHALDMDGYIL